MADPLALSVNPKEKGNHVARSVAVDLNLPIYPKNMVLNLTAGNGSRGGGGVNLKGLHLKVRSLMTWFNTKSRIGRDFKFPNMVKKMADAFLKDASFIEVKLDGTATPNVLLSLEM